MNRLQAAATLRFFTSRRKGMETPDDYLKKIERLIYPA